MRYNDKRFEIKCERCSSPHIELHRLERREDKSNIRKYQCLQCNQLFQVRDFIVYGATPHIQREYWHD